MAVRLLCDKEPARGCFLSHLVLGRGGTQREIAVLELFGGEHAQYIRLVFGPGGGAVQFFAAFAFDHGGVVTGRDGIKSQCQPSLHDRIKLDVLVTAHARVRGATLAVLIHKILNNIGGKALGEIPHVEGDAQHIGHAPRIHRIFDGAAAPRSGAQRAGLPRQRQVHAHHVVPGFHRAGSRHSAVHATAHRCQNLHGPSLNAVAEPSF